MNACIAIINKKASPQFEVSLTLALQVPGEVYIPSIGLHELWFGVAKSHRVRANTYNLLQFLKPPFQILDFDGRDARIAEEIRAELTRLGRPIGP